MEKIFIGVLLAFAVATQALAADEGVYVVGQVGRSTGMSYVSGSTSTGGLIGYQFNPNWAIEAGYTSLYSNASGSGPGFTEKYSANAITGAIAYIHSFNQEFSALIRLGLDRYSKKLTVATTSSPAAVSSSSNTVTGPFLGVAGQYNFSQSFGIRLGVDFLHNDQSGGSGTMENINTGIVYKF